MKAKNGKSKVEKILLSLENNDFFAFHFFAFLLSPCINSPFYVKQLTELKLLGFDSAFRIWTQKSSENSSPANV